MDGTELAHSERAMEIIKERERVTPRKLVFNEMMPQPPIEMMTSHGRIWNTAVPTYRVTF